MNKKWILFAADLLGKASKEFANHGCNELDWPSGWTLKEKREFVKMLEEENGTPEEYSPDNLNLSDFSVMWFLGRLLKKLAEKQ